MYGISQTPPSHYATQCIFILYLGQIFHGHHSIFPTFTLTLTAQLPLLISSDNNNSSSSSATAKTYLLFKLPLLSQSHTHDIVTKMPSFVRPSVRLICISQRIFARLCPIIFLQRPDRQKGSPIQNRLEQSSTYTDTHSGLLVLCTNRCHFYNIDFNSILLMFLHPSPNTFFVSQDETTLGGFLLCMNFWYMFLFSYHQTLEILHYQVGIYYLAIIVNISTVNGSDVSIENHDPFCNHFKTLLTQKKLWSVKNI